MDLGTPLRRIDRVQRSRPWLAFPLAVIRRFGDTGAGNLAATIAYYGFFSLFPLLLAMTSVADLALRSRPDLQRRLLDSALAQFPVVGPQIRSSVGAAHGSGVAIALGVALALWAGLGGIRAAQSAMDTVWDVPRRRRPGTPKAIGLSLLMLGFLGAFVVAGAASASLTAAVTGPGVTTVAFLCSVVINVASFAVAYRILTTAEVAWRDVFPGAVLGGVGWTALLTFGSTIVANKIASSSPTYGAFGVVVGLLGWIYLGAQLALLGAVLNVVVQGRLWPRSLTGELTAADERALRRSARQEERRPDETVRVRFGPRRGFHRGASGEPPE